MWTTTIIFVLGFICVYSQTTPTCGVQFYQPHTHNQNRQTRIVGGQVAIPHSWPWMVNLRFRTQAITCGGSIVRAPNGELVVITAAHCIDGQNYPADWKIDVGVHSRQAMEPNQMEYGVREIIQHPNFNFQFLEDDIAVMKPSTPIAENNYVRPICLTQESAENLVGQDCVVVGWGATVQGSGPVDTLNEVYKPILSDNDCNTALGMFGYDPNSMMCAGNLVQGGVDACSYDSGVPFACKNATTGVWELVGISSWGFGCAQPGYPGVYADVFNFLQWIHDNSQSSDGSGSTVGPL